MSEYEKMTVQEKLDIIRLICKTMTYKELNQRVYGLVCFETTQRMYREQQEHGGLLGQMKRHSMITGGETHD